MKKIIALLLFGVITMSSSFAFAAITDNRAAITALYGEYRFVIDTDNQLWTKAEWEAKGSKKAKANSYVHYFRRDGLGFQTEVQYENDKPDSTVRVQRITPDMGIQIKELKGYLPEIHELAVKPESKIFTTTEQLTRNFREEYSPVTMGIFYKKPMKYNGATYYAVLAVNIKDEGRLVNDDKNISKDTYINEIVIERKLHSDCGGKSWRFQKENIFQ